MRSKKGKVAHRHMHITLEIGPDMVDTEGKSGREDTDRTHTKSGKIKDFSSFFSMIEMLACFTGYLECNSFKTRVQQLSHFCT